jgi:hypothetical protein
MTIYCKIYFFFKLNSETKLWNTQNISYSTPRGYRVHANSGAIRKCVSLHTERDQSNVSTIKVLLFWIWIKIVRNIFISNKFLSLLGKVITHRVCWKTFYFTPHLPVKLIISCSDKWRSSAETAVTSYFIEKILLTPKGPSIYIPRYHSALRLSCHSKHGRITIEVSNLNNWVILWMRCILKARFDS